MASELAELPARSRPGRADALLARTVNYLRRLGRCRTPGRVAQVLEWSRHEKALFDCASDVRCPKQDFFLRVLYLIVGDAVRTDYRSTPRPIVEGFVIRGDDYRHPAIQNWQQRSRELMKHPDRFEYEAWCAGGLVRNDRS